MAEWSYELACVVCATKHNLSMYAHRHRKEGPIVGWILACITCSELMKSRDIQVSIQDLPNTD